MLISDMEQKIEKILLVSKGIVFALGAKNSQNPQEDTCHWQPICYETPLRFNMSLKEIFSRSASLRVMKKFDENALMQTVFWNGLF